MNTTYRKVDSAVGTRQKTRDESNEVDQASVLGIQIIMAIAAIVGIWGFCCLAAGLSGSESFIELGSKWVSAVLGL